MYHYRPIFLWMCIRHQKFSKGAPCHGTMTLWPVQVGLCYTLCVRHCVVSFCMHRSQVRQFHRRFDERQPWELNTDPVAVWSVWSVFGRCTKWSNCLALLSILPSTVPIRHRSVTTVWPLGRLWSWSACKRYENVEYQYQYWYLPLNQTAVQCCYFSYMQKNALRLFCMIYLINDCCLLIITK